MISGHASRGNWFRCFQRRTAPGFRQTLAAKAAGPPFASMISAAELVMFPTLLAVTTERKRKITPRNGTMGNVGSMADEFDKGWEDLEGPWDRLRWARRRWQLKTGAVAPTASDAAQSLGIEAGTYRSYERPPGTSKHTAYGHQLAIQFGRRFRVSWPWLLTGEGAPFDHLAPAQERAMRAIAMMDDEQQEAFARMAEAFAHERRTGTSG